MMKRLMLAAGLIGAVATTPAAAVTYVKTPGSITSFAAPVLAPFNVTINYDDTNASAPGFALSGSGYRTFDSSDPGNYQMPAFSDGSAYLAVLGGERYELLSTGMGYNQVSFFIGSLDALNQVEILGTDGLAIATYSGATLALPETATGSALSPQQNARFTFSLDSTDTQLIGGVRLTTGTNSIEVDNVVFGAVPEPSTWALMLAGFGMVGMTMRARRRRTNVVFG